MVLLVSLAERGGELGPPARSTFPRSWLSLGAALAVAVVGLSCAGRPNVIPVPLGTTITLSPSASMVGADPTELVVNGMGFTKFAKVEVGGSPVGTDFLSSTTLQATIPSSQLVTAGKLEVSVADGARSTLPAFFTVNNPEPIISSITPPQAVAGEPAVLVTLTGRGFVSTSVVEVGGVTRLPSAITPTQISATLAAGDLLAAGTLKITVVNPGPGGGISQPAEMPVAPPASAQLNVDAFGAVGSAYTTQGSIAAGSTLLQLRAPWDSSVVPQGIQIYHAGAPVSLAAPAPPSVLPTANPFGDGAPEAVPSNATCSYAVAALDAAGGETAASEPTTILTSAASLGPLTFQNRIQWAGTAGAQGYAVYGDCDGGWALVTIVDLPEDALPWTGATAVPPGQLLLPAAPNGFVYRARPIRFRLLAPVQGGATTTVAVDSTAGVKAGQLYDVDWGSGEEEVVAVSAVGSSQITAYFASSHPPGAPVYGLTGPSEPAWPKCPGGSVDDGAVEWDCSLFTAFDFGEPMVGASGTALFDVPPTVSLLPPATPLADTLATDVTGITSDRTLLTLASPAVAGVAGGGVAHDDLAAIQAAFDLASSSSLIYQIFPGGQSEYSTPQVVFPPGEYMISAPIRPLSALFSIAGEQGAIVAQTSATQDVIHADVGSGFHVSVADMTFRGGRTSLWLGSPDVDGSLVNLSGDTFLSSLGYAVYSIGLEAGFGQRANDIHLSQQITDSGSLAFGCRAWIFSTSDVNTLDDEWVEMAPQNSALGSPVISLFGAEMTVSGGAFIPGDLPFGAHWVDDRGEAFYSLSTRWSAEGSGGIPVVFDYENPFSSATGGKGSRNYQTGSAWDTVVSIRDGELTVGQAVRDNGPVLGAVNCITGCPALLTVSGNYWAAPYGVLVASPGVDLATYFTASPLDYPDPFLTGQEIHYDISDNDMNSPAVGEPEVPAALVPYLVAPALSSAPAEGNWYEGQQILQLGGAGAGVWTVTAPGKLAPGWKPISQYCARSLVVAPAPGTGVYIAAVPGTSGAAVPDFARCTGYSGCTVTDGSVVWRYYGPSAEIAFAGN